MKRATWKPVPGFAGRYEVSDAGQVRRVSTGRILKPQKPSSGTGHMLFFSVRDEKTTVRLARLVGAAFCPDFAPEKVPVFRNGNTNDYRAKNLRWVPRSVVSKPPYSKNPRQNDEDTTLSPSKGCVGKTTSFASK